MNNLQIKFINLCYLLRMFKDKSYQSAINWYYGDTGNVERIYKENETIYSHISKLCTQMTPIIDNIILGNACDASFYSRLEDANISTIINVTKEIPNYFEKYFKYQKIKLNDQNKDKVKFTNEIFDQVNSFIESQQTKNAKNIKHNILIHCYMGSSRSATVTASYIIYKYGYTVDECVKLIHSKREIMNINTGFMENLQDYYEYCQNKKYN